MNQKLFKVTAVITSALAVVMLLLLKSGMAREDGRQLHLRLKKPDIVTQVRIGVNNWSYVMLNNGVYMLDQAAGSAGGEFPRGSGHTIVYSGGFNMAVLKSGYKVVTNVQPSDGGTQMRPGAILNSDTTFIALEVVDPASPDARVYYITDTHTEANWPGLRQSNGDPGVIAPGQTWAVFNDRDTTRELTGYAPSKYPGVSPGVGAEVTLESYAFDVGPMADAVFLKFTLINKTNANYPGAYLGVYMDPDVEDYSNDVVGSDTLLGLGFCYNGDNSDPGKTVGIDFLQGPIVNTAGLDAGLLAKFASNTSTLVYDPVGNRYVPTSLPSGKIWLGATSFVRYASGTAPDDDSSTYNLIAGFRLNGTPKITTGDDYKYAYPADPVTAPLGDPNVQDPATGSDVRMMHGVGPFTIGAGDTQVVWAAVIGASGSDRFAAITQLRTTDAAAQKSFDLGLLVPKAPSIPKMSVNPLDGQVVITWDNSAEYTVDTYGAARNANITYAAGYFTPIDPSNLTPYDSTDFEGYRVYRSRTGLPGSFTQLAEFDVVDGITTVSTRSISASGNIVMEDVHVGTDNGIKYRYIDNDVINNQQYFYTVTSFDAQAYIAKQATIPFDAGDINIPGGIPVTIESPLSANLVFARPMAPILSTKYDAAGNFSHATGASDAIVDFEIVDPTKVQSATYTVEFYNLADSINHRYLTGWTGSKFVYRVKRGSEYVPFSNKVDNPNTFYDSIPADPLYNAGQDSVLDDKYFHNVFAVPDANLSDEQFGIVDGLLIKAYGPVGYFNRVTYTQGPQFTALNAVDPNKYKVPWWTGSSNAGAGTAAKPHHGVSEPNLTIAGILSGGPLRNANGTNNSAGSITTSNKNFRIEFSRDSTKWQYAYCTAGSTGGMVRYVRVPFRVYEIDSTDGALAPRQINMIARLTHYDTGTPNGMWMPQSLLTSLDDGLGPELRSVCAFDTSTYDLGSKTGSFGLLAGGEHMNGITLYGVGSANYAGFFTSFRNNDGDAEITTGGWTGTYDGLAYRDSIRRTMVYDTTGDFYNTAVVPWGMQTLLYRSIPDEGTLTVKVNHPITTSDTYTFTAAANTVITSKSTLKKALKDIKVVPNPYYGRTSWQKGIFDKKIKFTNLPAVCTIKIFTVAGDLITTIKHNVGTNNDRVNATNPLGEGVTRGNEIEASAAADKETSTELYDLRNTGKKIIASGMYIALIDAPGIGKTTVKFAVIQESIISNNPDVR